MSSVFIHTHDWGSQLIRLGGATAIGAAIGWNRQRAGKSAGLRTHMLVSLGAALFVLIPLTVGSGDAGDSLSRAIQGIATGVGFLGAGEILHQSRRSSDKQIVKGLTSAATIWVTAALGIVAGCGLWQLGLGGTFITLLILSGVKRLEQLPILHEKDED